MVPLPKGGYMPRLKIAHIRDLPTNEISQTEDRKRVRSWVAGKYNGDLYKAAHALDLEGTVLIQYLTMPRSGYSKKTAAAIARVLGHAPEPDKGRRGGAPTKLHPDAILMDFLESQGYVTRDQVRVMLTQWQEKQATVAALKEAVK